MQRRGAVGVVRVRGGALVEQPAHGHEAGRGAELQQVPVQASDRSSPKAIEVLEIYIEIEMCMRMSLDLYSGTYIYL